MDDEQGDRVCVVGAGLSGLVTAKVLKRDGFDVTVFEKEPTVGGVWAPHRAYAGLCVQNPREHYAFSDFPYPETCDEFPTAEQAYEYLKSYARHFGLEPHLRLSTEVLALERRDAQDGGSHPGFRVTVQPTDGPGNRSADDAPNQSPGGSPNQSLDDSGKTETHQFDFVVVCNGVFSRPYRPQIEGEERFDGSLIHSSQLSDRELLDGERAVVVGGGKSALDCASVAAHEATSSTLVFRTPHWMLPRYFPGDTRVDEVFFTRFSEKILPAYLGPSRTERAIRTVAAPLLWLWRRGMSLLVSKTTGMPPEMVPEKPITTGAENLGIGTQFYEALEEGSAGARRGEIESFTGADTLRLDSGEELEADLVVFATGWRQGLPLLDSELRESVRRDGKFHLYRHILPPRESRLGFVGYASAGNNALASEISAHWLSECFLGELELPDAGAMEQRIARRHEWAAEVYPGRDEGYFVGGHLASFVDELVEDMGLPTRRTDSFFTEYFEPVSGERYEGLGRERRLSREGWAGHPGSG